MFFVKGNRTLALQRSELGCIKKASTIKLCYLGVQQEIGWANWKNSSYLSKYACPCGALKNFPNPNSLYQNQVFQRISNFGKNV